MWRTDDETLGVSRASRVSVGADDAYEPNARGLGDPSGLVASSRWFGHQLRNRYSVDPSLVGTPVVNWLLSSPLGSYIRYVGTPCTPHSFILACRLSSRSK